MRVDRVRNDLLQCYDAALREVDGEAVVAGKLADWPGAEPVSLIAVGKAADAMARGAFRALGSRIVDGLLVTKHGHLHDAAGFSALQCYEADHPIPGLASLRAGQALLEYCRGLAPDRAVIFCLSGGASSLVEVLRDGVSLDDLQAVTRASLAGGEAIAQINARRRAMSRIKGGRLADFLLARPVDVLVISDVEGDDLSVIGSGLLYAGADTRPGIRHHLVATLDQARRAACRQARALGYPCRVHPQFLGGPVEKVAAMLAETLQSAEAGIHVWGGEPVVKLPKSQPDSATHDDVAGAAVRIPGRGGRNQHLALLLADQLQGWRDRAVLVAGTDGTDGPTADAGALVDGGTLERGELGGVSARWARRAYASGEFLEAAGDLITTGPTGTNVMDLVIAWIGEVA